MTKIDESRRKFLKGLTGSAVLAAVPFGSAKIPVFDVTVEEFFQKHYKEMTPQEKKRTIERIERNLREEYGVEDIEVTTTEPQKGVVFGYALNIRKCIGCRRCVYACMRENNQSRSNPQDPTDGQIQWIRVISLPKFEAEPGTSAGGDFRTKFGKIETGINLEENRHYYQADRVPQEEKFYVPIQCQQCENPPCVKVCPTKATWKEPDGIIVVDYNWCIGCRFCIGACPYWARRFNWGEPYLPREELNPHMHYLGNRPRMRGTVEKCTYCIQRSREGRYPACVEICPVGARKFGNLLDPESEVRKVIEEKRVFRLKEELGTDPKFFYFMD